VWREECDGARCAGPSAHALARSRQVVGNAAGHKRAPRVYLISSLHSVDAHLSLFRIPLCPPSLVDNFRVCSYACAALVKCKPSNHARMLGTPRCASHGSSAWCAFQALKHNQASARFPENTLASFEAAIRDGAEGLESGEPAVIFLIATECSASAVDVHVSTDDIIIMFHDPSSWLLSTRRP
jgi:hypothetical protein